MCSFCQYSITKKTSKHLLTERKREKVIYRKTHHLIICCKISLKALKQPSQKFWPKLLIPYFFTVTFT